MLYLLFMSSVLPLRFSTSSILFFMYEIKMGQPSINVPHHKKVTKRAKKAEKINFKDQNQRIFIV